MSSYLAGFAAGAGASATSLFGYNRENFMYDREQRLKKEFAVLNYRVEQASLWRDDVRDLISLTEYKMHAYLLVTVLLLGQTIVLFCEGKLPEDTPDWLVMGNVVSICGAFMFLLLSMWYSMYAAVTCASYQARLLTQVVRLPIPSWQEVEACRTYASEFEQVEAKQMFRVPYVMGRQEQLVTTGSMPVITEEQDDARQSPSTGSPIATPTDYDPEAGSQGDVMKNADPWGFERRGDDLPELGCQTGSEVARQRHVKLTHQAMAFWQSYDAYARIALSVGVNQLLLAMCYYILGYIMVEAGCRAGATYGVVLLVVLAEQLMKLDMSLSAWQLRQLQFLIFSGPLLSTAAAFHWSMGHFLMLRLAQTLIVAAFISHALLLACLIWWCAPKRQGNNTSLPTAFRSVLYLDVFGWVKEPGLCDSLSNDAPPGTRMELPQGGVLESAGGSPPGDGDQSQKPALCSIRYADRKTIPRRPEDQAPAGSCCDMRGEKGAPCLDSEAANQSAAFFDATTWLSADATGSPLILHVVSPNGQQDCAGEYRLQPGQRPNGQPLWYKTDDRKGERWLTDDSKGERWLYSGTNGKWFIAGHAAKDEKFNCSRGYLATLGAHGGAMPNEVAAWQRWDGEQWPEDQGVAVEAEDDDSESCVDGALSSIVTGHEHESPRLLPWRIFAIVASVLAVGWILAAIYHFLRIIDERDRMYNNIHNNVTHGHHRGPEDNYLSPLQRFRAAQFLSDVDKGSADHALGPLQSLLQFLSTGDTVTAKHAPGQLDAVLHPEPVHLSWPHSNVMPVGLSCDASGEMFTVTDGVLLFSTNRRGSLGKSVHDLRPKETDDAAIMVQSAFRTRDQEPRQIAPSALTSKGSQDLVFDEDNCAELLGEDLQDLTITCPTTGIGRGAECAARVLHRGGHRVATCFLGGHAPNGADGDHEAMNISDAWLERLRLADGAEPHPSDESGLHRRSEIPVALAADVACHGGQGQSCTVVATSHGRVVELRRHSSRDVLIPASVLHEAASPLSSGAIRAIGSRYLGILETSKDKQSVLILDTEQGGAPVGKLRLPAQESPVTGFCAGGGYLYMLGDGPSPNMWRAELAGEILS